MRLFVLAALLAGACSPRPSAPAEGDRPSAVTGTVQRVDLSPMAYDGDAEITLLTEAGETVEVRVPARMNLCEASGLGNIGTLREGDEIEVVGAMESGVLRPCSGSDHRISRAGYTMGTYMGTFASGFETSGMKGCDDGEANWWIVQTDDLSQRYQTIMRDKGIRLQGRGLGPFVRLRVEGELSPVGTHGPLETWDRELVVTRVLEMEYLAPGDGEWPVIACE